MGCASYLISGSDMNNAVVTRDAHRLIAKFPHLIKNGNGDGNGLSITFDIVSRIPILISAGKSREAEQKKNPVVKYFAKSIHVQLCIVCVCMF